MLCERCRAEIEQDTEFSALLKMIEHKRYLPLMEHRLLKILFDRRNAQRIVSRETLMTLLYEDSSNPPYGKIIDVMISRLRSRLPTGVGIENLRAQGWRLLVKG